MSWRTVTEADLLSSLSQKEIDAFRKSSDLEHDPVESQIRQVCAYVRGCIRAGGAKVKMASGDDTLPESLISPAMDYLRYNLLTRQALEVNESRTKSWEAARETFDQIRRGEFVPESDGPEEEGTAKATSPTHGEPHPSRLLD